MGKTKTLHTVSGKLGPLIYYEMKGKQYVRTAPSKVKQPNTPAQLGNKRRFALATYLASKLYAAFETWYLETDDQSKRAYNQLQSMIQKTGIKGDAPDLKYDWNRLNLTQGSLEKPLFTFLNGELTWNIIEDKKAIQDWVILVGIHTITLEISKWIVMQTKGVLHFESTADFAYYVFRTCTKNGKVKVSASHRI